MLAADQVLAMDAIMDLRARCGVLTGPAGTGKTYLQGQLKERALARWDRVEFISSTGRAASRLRDTVNAPVRTCHAATFGSVKEERVVDDAGKAQRTGRLIFGLPRPPCEPGSLLVCDEGSMVDVELHDTMMSQLPPGATMLYVGDREQLPPASGRWGPDFDNPTAVLTTIHRQAWENPIIRLATAIRQGQDFDWSQPYGTLEYREATLEHAADWLVSRRRAEGGDATVLTWTNRVRNKVNRLVRERLGLTGVVAVGDLMVCLANNYQHGLMNGETFNVNHVVEVPIPGFPSLLVRSDNFDVLVNPALRGASTTDFKEFQQFLEAFLKRRGMMRHVLDLVAGAMERDPEELEQMEMSARDLARMWLHVDYGFCLTTHKAQGSEWRDVAFLRCSGLTRQEYVDPDFVRRLTYTAATRARERLHIWDV